MHENWKSMKTHLTSVRVGSPARKIRGFQPVLDLIRNGGGPNTLDAAGPALKRQSLQQREPDNTYAFISG